MAVTVISMSGERVGNPAAAAQGGIPGTAGNVIADPSRALQSMAGPAASGIAVTPVQDPAVQTALSLEPTLAAGTWKSVRDRAVEAAVLADPSFTGGSGSVLGLDGVSALRIGWGGWHDIGDDPGVQIIHNIDGGVSVKKVPGGKRKVPVQMWVSSSVATSGRRADSPETASLSALVESLVQMDLSAQMLVLLIKQIAAQQVLRMKKRIDSLKAAEEAAQREMLLALAASLRKKLAALKPQDPDFSSTERRLVTVESALAGLSPSSPN